MVYLVILIFSVDQEAVTLADELLLVISDLTLVPLPCSNPASLGAVLNSVSKYHSRLIQISLPYKFLPLFSLGSRFANFIFFLCVPFFCLNVVTSVPALLVWPVSASSYTFCSSLLSTFTRLLVPIRCFLLSVYRFYFFSMRCRGLVFACNLDGCLTAVMIQSCFNWPLHG